MAHVDDGELEMLLDGVLHLLPPERAEVVLRYVETEEGAERLARARDVHERSVEILSSSRPRVGELPDFAALKARSAVGAGAEEGGTGGAAGGTPPPDLLPLAPRRRGVSLLWAASLAAALGLGWMGRGLLQEPGGMGPAVALQEVGADAAPASGPVEEEMVASASAAPPAASAPAPASSVGSAEAEESVTGPPPADAVVAQAAPAAAQAGRLPVAAPPPAPHVADASPVEALRRSANTSVETTEVSAGAAVAGGGLPGVARLRAEIPAEADGVAPTPPPLLLATSPRTPPATWPDGWAESTPPVPGLPVLDVTSSGPYRVILQELDGGGVLEVRYGNTTPSPGARAAVGFQASPLPLDTVVPWLQGNALRLPRPGGWLELRAPVDEPTLRGWAGFLLTRETPPPR